MFKFQFLAQFPVDNLAHPVVSSLIFFLRWFVAFTTYVIDRFVSITFAVLLRLIYHGHLHVLQLFRLSSKIQVVSQSFHLLFPSEWAVRRTKSTRRKVLFYVWFSVQDLAVPFISKSQRISRVSFSRTVSDSCIYCLSA